MITFDHLRAALSLQNFDGLEAQMQMAPTGRREMMPVQDKPARQSAVLALVYPNMRDELYLILTKRTDNLSGHSGQVSLPGGSRDPEDSSNEVTALRETCEELGICEEPINLIGQLSKVWIPPSNFDVYPIVGTMTAEPAIDPNPAEVETVLRLALDDLVSDGIKRTVPMSFQDISIDVPYYDVEGHVVWGATCMMLSELEQRLKIALNGGEHRKKI